MATYISMDTKVVGNELFLAQRFLAEFYQRQKKGYDVDQDGWDGFKRLINKIEAGMIVNEIK